MVKNSKRKEEVAGDVRLEPELGIEQAAALHELLLPHLEDPAPVRLDAADVQRIHTSAIQLFCLFVRDRRAAGRDVEFVNPSPTLINAARLLGASTLLNLAQERA